MTPIVVYGGKVLAIVAVLVAVSLAVGVPEGDTAILLSNLIYPVAALGAGTLLVLGGMRRGGKEKRSWLLFGAGVL